MNVNRERDDPPEPPREGSWRGSRIGVMLAACTIVLATVAVYSNSLKGEFVFDDFPTIAENATIRRLWPLTRPLSPPAHGEPVTGRPLLNLSLAVNYAVGGLDVRGYHAANVLIHAVSALLLFGVVRRTLLLPSMQERWGPAATGLALFIALWWAVHPLQTESVAYISQRAESLVGLFYILTLYCVIRSADAGATRPFPWLAAAVLACLAGMACKEVMVSAPLIVLLYDRAFLTGSFRMALRKRGWLYAALAATWALLAWLVVSSQSRGGAAGFGLGMTPWEYLRTQFAAIVLYIRLSFWPDPLVMYYGAQTADTFVEIWPYAAIVGLLVAVTLACLWRWPKAGFLGAWFFAILAPSSSLIPLVKQTVAEHRMYLPLAAVLTSLVVGGCILGGRLVAQGRLSPSAWRLAAWSLASLIVVGMGVGSFLRNRDYRNELTIWGDTVAKMPGNALAHCEYARCLAAAGRTGEAIEHCRRALEIRPGFTDALNNRGTALAAAGRMEAAIVEFRKVLDAEPENVLAHINLGNALSACGDLAGAMAHYRKVAGIRPDLAGPQYNLGLVLVKCNQLDGAIGHFEKALQNDPDHADAENNLATALARTGRIDEAIPHYRRALLLDPGMDDAWRNLENALRLRASRSQPRE